MMDVLFAQLFDEMRRLLAEDNITDAELKEFLYLVTGQ